MHSLCIIHRDIKNENLFLESEEHLRIGDFGLARRLKRATEIFVEQQIVGTPLYLSPEVCAKGMYSTASDVWALGCSLFELCSLCLPFEAADFEGWRLCMEALMMRVAKRRRKTEIKEEVSWNMEDEESDIEYSKGKITGQLATVGHLRSEKKEKKKKKEEQPKKRTK
eukprot:s49_g18.t1